MALPSAYQLPLLTSDDAASVPLGISEAELARLYPVRRTIELAHLMGLTPRQVRGRAQKRGLRKGPQILSIERSASRKGSSATAETREKLRTALKDRRASDETRAALRLAQRSRAARERGITLEEWTPTPQNRLHDPAYYAWRQAVYERDGYRCRDCDYQGHPHSGAVYAHHILDWAGHPDARYDVKNGVTLCFACHCRRHGAEPRVLDPVPCACGCGTLIAPSDRWAPKRHYVNGHWVRTRPMTDAIRQKISAAKRGKPLGPDHARRSAEHLDRLRAAGLVHTPAARAKISQAKQGHAVSTQTREKLRLAALAQARPARAHRRGERGTPDS